MADFYKKRRLSRFYQKYGFDYQRLDFLKKELDHVREDIQQVENQRYA